MSDPYGGSTVREWDWVRLVSPHCAIDAGKAWRPAPLSENGIGFVWYSEVCYVRDQEHRRQRPAAVPVGLGSFGISALRDWRGRADPQTTWAPRPALLAENGIGFVPHGVVWRVRNQEHRRQRPEVVSVGLGSFRKFALRDWRVKELSVWVKASYPSSRLHHEVAAVWRNCFVISKK
jgi:hypothetical protein